HAAEFAGGESLCVILGDNILQKSLRPQVEYFRKQGRGARILLKKVPEPQRFGVARFRDRILTGIVEKPRTPPSPYAVIGVYFYDTAVFDIIRGLTPSRRGELEITDLNKAYLAAGKLHVAKLGRGTAWLDTGTHESLMAAAEFVRVIEDRQGLKVCCPEEIAWRLDYIDDRDLMALAAPLMQNSYGRYLERLVKHGKD
ncbi:MAG: glucose-1-phosphate thymidylyltransferase, partial [Proteobacteria bacterium]|nr:glucose-1-phosphate thymidylyltransferase [Pseudomonadota bacterium]